MLGGRFETTERFEREARAAARLRHPNVVPVLDLGTADGQAFLVMDLVRGESLGARLKREGPLPIAEAVRLVEGAPRDRPRPRPRRAAQRPQARQRPGRRGGGPGWALRA